MKFSRSRLGLGKTPFEKLMAQHEVQPRVGGFYSVAACFKNDVIKTLIAAMAGEAATAIAA